MSIGKFGGGGLDLPEEQSQGDRREGKRGLWQKRHTSLADFNIRTGQGQSQQRASHMTSRGSSSCAIICSPAKYITKERGGSRGARLQRVICHALTFSRTSVAKELDLLQHSIQQSHSLSRQPLFLTADATWALYSSFTLARQRTASSSQCRMVRWPENQHWRDTTENNTG